MHELGIMSRMLDMAVEAAEQQAPGGRILQIHVQVGPLSGVVVEALRFAFESLAPGSLAEGADLVIHETAPLFYCPDCKTTYTTPIGNYHCPACHSTHGELRGGNEIQLQHIEVQDHV